MAGSSRGTNSESANSGMPKPNCTITERHDQLLDELAKTRHASRSEALRTAIEDYSQSVSEEGRNVEERILQLVNSLTKQVQTIEEKLDKLENDTRSPDAPNHAHDKSPKLDKSLAVTGVEDNNDGHELENDVYRILSQGESLSLGSIASELDSNEIEVREAIDCLVDRGFVTCINQNGIAKYQIQTPSND